MYTRYALLRLDGEGELVLLVGDKLGLAGVVERMIELMIAMMVMMMMSKLHRQVNVRYSICCGVFSSCSDVPTCFFGPPLRAFHNYTKDVIRVLGSQVGVRPRLSANYRKVA